MWYSEPALHFTRQFMEQKPKRQLPDDHPNLVPDHIATGVLKTYACYARAITLFCFAMDVARNVLNEKAAAGKSQLPIDARLVMLEEKLNGFCMGFEVGEYIYPFYAEFTRKMEEPFVAAIYTAINEDGTPAGDGAGINLELEEAGDLIAIALETLVNDSENRVLNLVRR